MAPVRGKGGARANRGLRSWRKGHRAERIAGLWLRLKGYRILARRFQARGGEIDLVAVRGQVLAFVEVKARGTEVAGLEAVSRTGQIRITQAAQVFAQANPALSAKTWRFDVVVVPDWSLPRHICGAFDATS